MSMLLEPPLQPGYKEPDLDSFILAVIDKGQKFDKKIFYTHYFQPLLRYEDFIKNIWNNALRPVAIHLNDDYEHIFEECLYCNDTKLTQQIEKLNPIFKKINELSLIAKDIRKLNMVNPAGSYTENIENKFTMNDDIAIVHSFISKKLSPSQREPLHNDIICGNIPTKRGNVLIYGPQIAQLGLGYYGEALDTDADIKFMHTLAIKKESNFAIITLPIGKDNIIWNYGRIYGSRRLPLLFRNWTFLSSYGFNAIDLQNKSHNAIHATFILSSSPQAVNIPDTATSVQRRIIDTLAQHGAFNHQWYINQYPDVLSGQMDAISHYIIYGAKEGRKPTAWFDSAEYMKQNSKIDWKLNNPFTHYLNI